MNKRMYKVLFMATMATLAFVSCSKDQDLLDDRITDTIEFRTLANKGSKAAITNDDNILSFTVAGINRSNSEFLFDGFGITRGEQSTWDYTPKRYWPTTGTIDFYAYSPSSSQNVTKGLLKTTDTVIAYTVPQISMTNAQEDFLVARLTGQDKSKASVKLNFHHALSRVMFFAKTTQKNITYTIDKIELINLYESGELSLTAASNIPESGPITYGATAFQPWKSSGSKVNYTVDMGNSPIYMLNDYASVLGVTNAVMVLPQKTELGTTGSTAPAQGGAFMVKVSYKAFVEDQYYAGSATKSEEKYFAVKDPLTGGALTFEMGRQYNFKLTFGDEVGDPIKFEVGVSEWNNVPDIYVPELVNYFGIISNDLAKIANTSFDVVSNPVVTKEQMDAITLLPLSNKTSFDFKGLEHFKNLTSITLDDVQAGNLDASKVQMLEAVTITGSTLGNVNLSNGKLTTLTFSGENTFTSLNASNNKLTSVTFNSTPKIDGKLNLSGNTTLEAIDLSSVNYIASKTFDLNLSNCGLTSATLSSTKMSKLNLSNNQLTTLDVTSSTFENLDISNNKLLTDVNFDRSSVKTGTGTGLLNAKGNTALANFNTLTHATSDNAYVIDNLDIQDSKGITKIDVLRGNTIDTLTVWNGCTYTYLTASPAYILNIHKDGVKGYVNNIETPNGTPIP